MAGSPPSSKSRGIRGFMVRQRFPRVRASFHNEPCPEITARALTRRLSFRPDFGYAGVAQLRSLRHDDLSGRRRSCHRPCRGRGFAPFWRGQSILRMPGAHNGMAALQAKAAGFERALLCQARQRAHRWAFRTWALSWWTKCASSSARWRARAACPCSWTATQVTARRSTSCIWCASFEDAGAAAVHIEDQLLPKKLRTPERQKSWPMRTTWRPRLPRPARAPAASVHRGAHRCRRQ